MSHPAKATPFRLSRIHAQGWNAAREAWKTDGAPANPYDTEPERSYWQTGFRSAQAAPKRMSQ